MLLTLKNTRHGSLPGNGSGGFIAAIKHPSPGSFIMTKRIEYQKDEKIGSCIYLYSIERGNYNNRCAMFRCKCGNEFESAICDVKGGHTQSCGCYHRRIAKEVNTIHGLSEHLLYKKWEAMKNRCENQNIPDFKNYGGRRITVCEEWRNDFKAYFDYVMSLENAMQPGLTIDRIRNNEGYKSGNLRWANRHIQAVNRRIRATNTSGYTGISVYNKSNRWLASITINGEKKYLGLYDSPIEAVKVRNQYIINNKLNEYLVQTINTHENGQTEITEPSGTLHRGLGTTEKPE